MSAFYSSTGKVGRKCSLTAIDRWVGVPSYDIYLVAFGPKECLRKDHLLCPAESLGTMHLLMGLVKQQDLKLSLTIPIQT